MAKLEKRAWWPDLVRLKDQHSLRELGRRFGVSPAAIQLALKRNGLSREKKRPGRPVGGRAQDSAGQVQARGRHARQYSEMRLAPFDAQVGRLPDAVIAEKAGLSAATVARIRRARGISAPSSSSGRGRGNSKVAIYEDLLGKLPDAEVAHLAGVSRAAVRNYRVRRGISSPGGTRETGASTTATENVRKPAWILRAANQEPVVILSWTLTEVLKLAESRGVQALSIERLPPVL